MRSETIGSAFDTHRLRLIGCLAALAISEASAGALFSRSFAAGFGPVSVAVADLDGDTVSICIGQTLQGPFGTVCARGTLRALTHPAPAPGRVILMRTGKRS